MRDVYGRTVFLEKHSSKLKYIFLCAIHKITRFLFYKLSFFLHRLQPSFSIIYHIHITWVLP